MDISKQVINLSQAKKLKELGVVQEGYFYWIFDSGMKWRLFPADYYDLDEDGIESVSAFTVAELGKLLPTMISSTRNNKGWYIPRTWIYSHLTVFIGEFPNESEARAALLIHLLETKIISVEEVNARLK